MSDDIPAIRGIKTFSITCANCHRHVGTVAQFIVDDWFGKDYQCPHCGCTSVNSKEGRTIGKGHREWPQLHGFYTEAYPDMWDTPEWLDMFVIENNS